MHPLIPQAVGLLAVAAFLLSYQQKKRKNIILLNVISRLLYISQYILLGLFSGAVLDVLGTLSSVIAGKKDTPFIRKHLPLVLLLVNLAVSAAGVAIAVSTTRMASADGGFSVPLFLFNLLPLVGVLLHTGAFWMSDERHIRRVSLAGSPFWFVYNFFGKAYFSSVGDALSMLSIIIAMIRYRKVRGETAAAASPDGEKTA